MTRQEYITKQDRRVWELYRQTWSKADSASAVQAELDGTDAARIAAFLEGRLSEDDRRALERDLVARSELLDTLLAAEAGLYSGPTHASEAPHSIKAWATNVYESELSNRRRPLRKIGERRRWFARPVFAAAAATVVLLIAAGVGTYFGLKEPARIIATDAEKAKQPGEKWDTRGNSIFKDPENAIFDGLDVE